MHGNPPQYSCLENPHGQRRLADYSPCGRKESDTTERLNSSTSTFFWCSITHLWPTLCDSMDCSMLGIPVFHHFLELAQTHAHWVSDAIQPSHPLWSPSPPAFNLSQHQGLFKWVSSSHQVAKVLKLQFQHQSFQWIFRIYFLQDLLSKRLSRVSSNTTA